MEEEIIEGRSLAETPTWSVASVTTVMVFFCLFAERSMYRFGKWLKKTRRKALLTSLEKIKEEMMLLGLISLMLGQWARSISEICVDSSLFNSRFYLCSKEDYDISHDEGFYTMIPHFTSHSNHTATTTTVPAAVHHTCGEGREPFVSQESLEELHRFLFVLGITHVLYSCITVGLSMIKIYSWRKWEYQAISAAEENLPARTTKVMRRQSTFVFHHTSHPWSRNRVLIWMLCFLRQFKSSIKRSDYMALRLGFITKHKLPLTYNFHRYMARSMEEEFRGIVGISWPLWIYAIICIFVNIHGLNIYFWLSFVPVILVMLVGTKLQHVVSLLALEIMEAKGPSGAQVKPRDDLFWFGKPQILLWLIQFISFQNAFEMATFIWSLWGLKRRSCFMKNHVMVVIRLASGLLVQFWCSYSTVPLNVIVTQMGSRCKKAVIAESVRESLHSWCKRVKEKSKCNSLYSSYSVTARSTCSLESIADERDEITVASCALSRCGSVGSLNEITAAEEQNEHNEAEFRNSDQNQFDQSLRISDRPSNRTLPPNVDNDAGENASNVETLLDLFRRT
ncbi:hypothetical protein Scep_002967 [Stephania cephalantha]|uniref:MLO-like protein n=1 Tax=Stephania cephalantha TaxID=152367 RepID=A0AAP0LB74_9MAGN